MPTPPIPEGQCVHCHAPIVDLFAEWTEEYQKPEGKRPIMAGAVVFDCYYCEGPLQLVLPLALVLPHAALDQFLVAKRLKARCENWLRSQHPGETPGSRGRRQVVEDAGWRFGARWAFDGYNWGEGGRHRHGQDVAPGALG